MKKTYKESVLDFIKNSIVIDRFPTKEDIENKHKDCKVIINVSDEFYIGSYENIMENNKLNFYFPMSELSTSMGLHSIFGALQVLYDIYSYHPGWKVLIHCAAGRNRSPTIKYAFYYMMLGEHHENVDNRLIYNSERGYLPKLEIMESFLKNTKEAFDNKDKFFGGMLDWIIDKTNSFSDTLEEDNTDLIF